VGKLFGLRDFLLWERLRILLDSIAEMDLYRIGLLEHSLSKTDLYCKDAERHAPPFSRAVAARSRGLLQ
jgi:hypothetical protein